ncbi:MAG: hypothetical protein DMF69_15550 [Acidobacteria bacterium]|nr:MAG: hypothetical protein DMF69_15550 [Acidobacteriota bacterium]
MQKYRRIEITAFRRRVTIVSSESPPDTHANKEVSLSNTDSQETIETASAEGRRILAEAVRLLEEKLAD